MGPNGTIVACLRNQGKQARMRLKVVQSTALLLASTTVLFFTERFHSSNIYAELPLTLKPRPANSG